MNIVCIKQLVDYVESYNCTSSSLTPVEHHNGWIVYIAVILSIASIHYFVVKYRAYIVRLPYLRNHFHRYEYTSYPLEATSFSQSI